jgi:tellurite resistance protein
MTAPKIPMNLFAIPFGLAGLGEAWSALSTEQHAPASVGDVILLISAASWLVLMAAHLRHLVTVATTPWAEINGDLLDPVLAPFTSLIVITPILLASDGLFPHAATPGRVFTDVFIALTVALAGWFVGQWFVEPLDLDHYHPGYFLPTVAGSLVASQAAALVGQQRLAEVLLGSGVISWIVVGSLIMGRLLWSFTFSWAAVAAAAIVWLQSATPPGYRGWQYLIIAAVTALVGGITIRTVIAVSRHQLLPRPAATPTTPAAAPAASPQAVTATS